MKLSEAKLSLSTKLNIDYSTIASNDLYSDADLLDWLQSGTNKAWDYRRWIFTEDNWKTITTSDGYNDYPGDCEDESIDKLWINGQPYTTKVDFADYETFFYLNPSSTERIWSEHKRFYFYNKNADPVGSEVWFRGKNRAPTLADPDDLLPFSPSTDDNENSGNHAIVRLAFAAALGSEKLKNYAQSAVEEKAAYGMLDVCWEPIAARRSAQQSKDRPFFDTPDFFGPSNGRGSTNIGNFP